MHCRTEQEPKPSRLNFRPGWRNANWKCIRRRPRSSTARTESDKEISECHIRLSWLSFRPRRLETQGNAPFCRIQSSSQPLGDEGHAEGDPGLEHETNHHSDLLDDIAQATESAPSGVDSVLRTVWSLGAGSLAALRQLDAAWPGRCGSSSAFKDARSRQPLSEKMARGMRDLFDTLAYRYDRRVCLMGAV